MGVFDATSDNDASMVKGMEAVGFGGGDCAPHTVELSANKFYDTPGIKEVGRKVKGMTEHFHRIGGAHMEDFHSCQDEYNLPRRKPKSIVFIDIDGTTVLWTICLACACIARRTGLGLTLH
eukprot:7769028-Pyramimonas_sp.AAC.2